jgi:hypothetical protein
LAEDAPQLVHEEIGLLERVHHFAGRGARHHLRKSLRSRLSIRRARPYYRTLFRNNSDIRILQQNDGRPI